MLDNQLVVLLFFLVLCVLGGLILIALVLRLQLTLRPQMPAPLTLPCF